jgi:hypothetical protein
MPPRPYTVVHPTARLSAADAEALIRGLEATLGGNRRDAEATRERDAAARSGPSRSPGPPS